MADSLTPDILALELPPLAVPLFRRYADSDRVPPQYGGEMSAAIQAADTEHIVGIDGPSAPFLVQMFRTIRNDGTLDVATALLRSVLSATFDAIWCRLAASLPSVRAKRKREDRGIDYQTDVTSSIAEQAEDERRHLSRARSIMKSFGTQDAASARDAARESHMVDTLEQCRDEGDVLAIVGRYHLDRLTSDFEQIDAYS